MAGVNNEGEPTTSRLRRSRRELMAGAAGALGVAAVGALGRATPASAGTDGDVVLGASNSATHETFIAQTTANATAFAATAPAHGIGVQGGSNQGAGVEGYSQSGDGVLGMIPVGGTGKGVHGTTYSGDGVYGVITGDSRFMGAGNGVHGVTPDPKSSGVLGENTAGGDGVKGTSASSNGVHGISDDLNGVGAGVLGEQQGAAGIGVVGIGTIGVQGNSNAQGHTGVIGEGTTGVYGQALTGGTGLLGINAFDGTGLALEAAGPAKFDSAILAARAGVVAIKYPNRTASVAVPGGLKASSLVLATMQNAIAGVFLVNAAPNTGTGKAAITLNKAPGSASTPLTAKVAWFVVN